MRFSTVQFSNKGAREVQTILLTRTMAVVYSVVCFISTVNFYWFDLASQTEAVLVGAIIYALVFSLVGKGHFFLAKTILVLNTLAIIAYLSIVLGKECHVQWLAAAFMITIARLFSGDEKRSGFYTAGFFALSSLVLVFCLMQSVFAPIEITNQMTTFFQWNSILAFIMGTSFSQYFWFKHARAAERRSEESQKFLELALDYMPVSVFVKNPQDQFKISFWNKASERIYGIPKEQAIGKVSFAEATPEEAMRIADSDRRAVEGGGHSIVDSYATTSLDGSTRYLRTTKTCVNQTLLLGITEDITEITKTFERLQDSQRFNSTLINSSSVGVFQADSDGKCLFVNPAMSELLKLTPHQMIGRKWYHALSKAEYSRIKPVWLNYATLKTTFSETTQMLKEDGTIFWCLIQFSPVYNSHGNLDFHVGTITDVSHFKQVESDFLKMQHELRTANLHLEALFENMAEGVVVQNANGEIVDANSAARNILGLDEQNLLKKKSTDPDWNAIQPDGSPYPGSEHPAMVVLSTGVPQFNKVMGLKRKDSTTWIQISSTPIFDAGTRLPSKVITTFTDITEMKALEKRNEAIRERLQLGVSAMNFGIWDWDLIDNGLVWDDNMYKLFGIESKDFAGDFDAFEKTVHPEDMPRLNAQLEQTFAERKDFASEFRIITKSGEIRFIKARATAFYSEKGIQRMVGVNWDVTHEREQEARLIQSSKMSSLGEMSSGIAHEINNPLSVILGNTFLLKKSITDATPNAEKIEGHLEKINANCVRIERIIKALRAFARDGSTDKSGAVSLQSILEDSIAICSAKLKHENIRLSLKVSSDDIKLDCSPTQIGQVMVNLIGNASDAIASLSDKWIAIDVVEENSVIKISVTDSGSGIPLAVRDKIMQPFFTTKAIGKGTGLGLSISSGIIKSHGGQLFIDTKSPNTCFVVELPVASKS